MYTDQELNYKNKIEKTFEHIQVLGIKKLAPGLRRLELLCKEHGVFYSKYPSILYTKFACEKCSHVFRTQNKLKKSRISVEDLSTFFTKLYGENCSFRKSTTPNKMFVSCPFHGEKERYISSVKKRCCVECYTEQSIGSSTLKVSFDLFYNNLSEEKIKKFKYHKLTFISLTKPMKIECPIHGLFSQIPSQHLKSIHGCFKCIPKSTSKKEIKWISSLNISVETQYPVKVGKKRYLVDAIDLNNKIIYEFLGDFWHGNLNIYTKETVNKVCKTTMECLYLKTEQKFIELNSLGYTVVYSWESDPPLTQRVFKGTLKCTK